MFCFFCLFLAVMQPLLITRPESRGSQCYNRKGNTNGTVLIWQHSLEVDFGVTCPGQLILCECVFVCVCACCACFFKMFVFF